MQVTMYPLFQIMVILDDRLDDKLIAPFTLLLLSYTKLQDHVCSLLRSVGVVQINVKEATSMFSGQNCRYSAFNVDKTKIDVELKKTD